MARGFDFVRQVHRADRRSFVAVAAGTIVWGALLGWALLRPPPPPPRAQKDSPLAGALRGLVLGLDARGLQGAAEQGRMPQSLHYTQFRQAWRRLGQAEGQPLIHEWLGLPAHTRDVETLIVRGSRHEGNLLLAAALLRRTPRSLDCRLRKGLLDTATLGVLSLYNEDDRRASDTFYQLLSRWTEAYAMVAGWGRQPEVEVRMLSLYAKACRARDNAHRSRESERRFRERLRRSGEMKRMLSQFDFPAAVRRPDGSLKVFETLLEAYEAP